MGMVGVAEGNTANHAAVGGEVEVAPDQSRVTRQSGLRERAEAKRLGRQHEVADIRAAIDRAIDTKRLVGVNDRHVRRAKEIVVFQRLPGIGSLVAARNAEGIVELKTTLAAAIEIDAF